MTARHERKLMLLVAVGSLATIAIGWWYYARQRDAVEATVAADLTSIAAAKSRQIAAWRRGRLGDGRILASVPVTKVARSLLIGGAVDEAERASIADLMGRLAREFQYSDATLARVDGSSLLRLRSEETAESALRQNARRRLIAEALAARDAVLSDLTLDTRDGKPRMFLTSPVDDQGAFILEIDPERFLYPYLESQTSLGRTGETFLIRREEDEVVFLSRRRLASAEWFPRRPLSSFPVTPDALLESGQPIRLSDYRGVPVLGTARRIEDSPWYLIVKVDADEVAAQSRRLAWEMALITAVVGLASVAGAGRIARRQREREFREREAHLHAVANDTPALLWISSADEEYPFINRTLAGFLGTSQQRLPKGWPGYVHPDDAGRVRGLFAECFAARRDYRDEFRLRRHDGEYRWVIDRGRPRFSISGEFLGYAGSLLDITERRHAEEQLRAANETLEAELKERIRREERIHTLSTRLIAAQEEERKRLARELHDDLNQQIAAASIAVGNLKRHIPEDQTGARGQSDRIHAKLVQLSDAVRRLSHELHPAVLQYSGLAPAMREYCQEFGELTGVHVSLSIAGSFDDVSSSVALCVYRVAQEALRNVARHARTQAAEVTLDRSEGTLRLTVADEGVGMDLSRREAKSGLGLVSIEERTRLVNGSVEIASRPHAGTTIGITIPV